MVLKSNIYKLGDQDDKATRTNKPRTHDGTHRDNVSEARRLIYYEGAGIKSTRVEALLKETSSVPTAVSSSNSIYKHSANSNSERLFNSFGYKIPIAPDAGTRHYARV
jgi:hypothetical protein